MTGKNSLPTIRYQAQQALLRREGLGLPYLAAKARLARVDALVDRIAARAEVRIADMRWKAHVKRVRDWHAEGCPNVRVTYSRFGTHLVDDEVEGLR